MNFWQEKRHIGTGKKYTFLEKKGGEIRAKEKMSEKLGREKSHENASFYVKSKIIRYATWQNRCICSVTRVFIWYFVGYFVIF